MASDTFARLEFFTLKVAGLEVEGCNLLPELREHGYRKKAELHGAPALRNSIYAEGNEIIISFRFNYTDNINILPTRHTVATLVSKH